MEIVPHDNAASATPLTRALRQYRRDLGRGRVAAFLPWSLSGLFVLAFERWKTFDLYFYVIVSVPLFAFGVFQMMRDVVREAWG